MISDRFYKLLHLVTKLGCSFGSFAISFDKNTYTVNECTDKRVKQKVLISSVINLILIFTSVFITVKEYFNGEINSFTFKLLFTLTLLLLSIIRAIPNICLEDILNLLKQAFGYFQFIQSKLYNLFYLIIFKYP